MTLLTLFGLQGGFAQALDLQGIDFEPQWEQVLENTVNVKSEEKVGLELDAAPVSQGDTGADTLDVVNRTIADVLIEAFCAASVNQLNV